MIVRALVTLLDVEPAIWRRIELPAEATLKGPHDAIQRAMGWDDYHLHHFEIGGTLYGEPPPEDDDYDLEIVSERKLKLATLAGQGIRAFEYVYDYGDDWHCAIVLEGLAPMTAGVRYPRLLDGARRGPPEDVGGPWGYAGFLEAIADPGHKRHGELMRWSGGGFDPNRFDRKQIDAALAKLSKSKAIARRKTKPATRKPSS